MHARVKAIFAILFLSSIIFGFAAAADRLLAPEQFETTVYPRTFQNGKIIYGIPYSGGDMGSCNVNPRSEFIYPPRSRVLVSKTKIFGSCILSSLPEGWAPPEYD
jgi:hypothetical protein